LLRKAGVLVRDSQDPHTPIWVPGFSYPAQYCIRQTRSLSQKLQVDNVDCIDLNDCMFGSQRTKVKVEDCKSDSGSVKSEQSTKSLKRKTSRRNKRRRRSNKLSQTSDSSDCGIELVPELVVSAKNDEDKNTITAMQSSFGSNGDVSVLLMEEPAVISNVMTQQAPLMGGDDDMMEPLTPECDVLPSAQQPVQCDNDEPVPLTRQSTEGNNSTDTSVLQLTEGKKPNDSPTEDSMQQITGNDDNTIYGLTESVLLSIEASCDQETGGVVEAHDQEEPDDMTCDCRFWFEQGSNLNSKVALCKDGSSSHLHCTTVLKVMECLILYRLFCIYILQHAIGDAMAPLLRISNIVSTTSCDENNRTYVAIQLTGYIVVWLHFSGSWTPLSHWAVTDEVKHLYVCCVSYFGISSWI